MDRLRRSFRRTKKNKSPKHEESVEAEPDMPMAAPPRPQTRLQKIRKSFRIKKKKEKEADIENDEKDAQSITSIDADKPPTRKSKLRMSLKLTKRKKAKNDDGDKPGKWDSDEVDVRSAKCSFPVKYLGSLEVQESRGIELCEESLKSLKKSKKKPILGTLHISGDGIQVVDKDTKGMIVDQTIEKVSFCAPDRNYDKGFAYICRDGTTKRWICHGFMAKDESGERLSHALGCAFAVCLEKKQQRQADCGVTMDYNEADCTFTRMGTFRQGTISERLLDPQTFKPTTPPPLQKVENPNALARPKVSDVMYQRQASFRGLGQLSGNSPFKRVAAQNASLRLNELPSTLQRIEEYKKEIVQETIYERSEHQNNSDDLCPDVSQEMSHLTVSDVSSINEKQAFKLQQVDIHNNNAENNKISSLSNYNCMSTNQSVVHAAINSPLTILRPEVSATNASNVLIMHHPVEGTKTNETLNGNNAPPLSSSKMPMNAHLSPPLSNSANAESSPIREVSAVPTKAPSSIFLPDNPWDNVPDQPKARQLAKSTKPAIVLEESPADLWLESLTNKIEDLSQQNNNGSNLFNGNLYKENNMNENMGSNILTENDEWSMLANRNHNINSKKQNTNPFNALI